MKFYYPKFLKTGPVFVGLSIFDLGLMAISLLLSTIFDLTSGQSLILILGSIFLSKIVSLKYPRGYFQHYFLKRSILEWRSDLMRLTQGVFI